MDLKDFMAESLRQIMEGIKEGQRHAEAVGGLVVPGDVAAWGGDVSRMPKGVRFNNVPGRSDGPFEISTIEYDVAITVSETSDRKGGLGIVAAVVTLGGTATNTEGSVSASRIKFSVPVAFPKHPTKPK